jgi:hypothetical protein
MEIKAPPLHSIWENDEGMKLFVDDLYDEADPEVGLEDGDEPTFFVTVVPYAQRDDMSAIGEELDPQQWESLVENNELRQTGIER